jgi:opacity protein-like surface antigen
MKNLKTLLFVCLACCCFQLKAQFGLGFQFPSYTFFNDEGVDETGTKVGFFTPSSAGGIGINAHYIIKPKMRVCLSLNYLNTTKSQTTATDVSTGQPINVFINVQTPLTSVHAEFQYDIVHDFVDKGFSFYALGGLAFNNYNYTTNWGGTQLNPPHQTVTSVDQTRSYGSVALELGLGIEYAFNKTTHLFLDVRGGTGQQTTYKTSNLSTLSLLPETFNPAYVAGAIGMRFNIKASK